MIRTISIACLTSIISIGLASASPQNLSETPARSTSAAPDVLTIFAGRSCDSNSKPADLAIPTPVCGWLMTNHFNDSIMLFDRSGRSIGSLTIFGTGPDRRVEWRQPPGTSSDYADDTTAIKNAELQAIANWIHEAPNNSGAGLAFVEWVLTLDNRLTSEVRVQSNMYSTLIGQPFALVAASEVPFQPNTAGRKPFYENLDQQSGLIGYWNAWPPANAASSETSSSPIGVTLLVAPHAEQPIQIAMPAGTILTVDATMPQIKTIQSSFLASPTLEGSEENELAVPMIEHQSLWSWLRKGGKPAPSAAATDQPTEDNWDKLENEENEP